MRIPLRQYWRLLVAYLRPQWPRALLLAVLLAASVALQLFNPLVIRYFIDTATAGGPTEVLISAALVFMGAALLNQLLHVVATYVGENVGWTATNALRSDLAEHCLHLDQSFHKARTPGELIERIDGDVNALSNFFSQFTIHMLSNLALVVGALVLLWGVDWRVGLGMTLFVVIAAIMLDRIRRRAVPLWTAERQTSAEFFGFLGEQLSGTEDIRSLGATGYVMRRFYSLVQGWFKIEQKAGLAGYSMWMTTLTVFAVGTAVAFALGAWLYSAGAITLGTVYLIFHYTEMLAGPIEKIRTQLQDLQRAEASIVRVQELFDTRSKLVDGPGAYLPPGALPADFEHVSFAYEDDGEHVLRDVNFTLRQGEVLGLLGRTGSGKTTLARLLLRLYDPTHGAVTLNGVDLRRMKLAGLRHHVGMVTQDVQLFNASVRDNLTFFDEAIPDDRILTVLEDLGLGPWLAALPSGLDTMLESGSGGLSAGEAQLLAFARLFLKDPGLVILDEASSRLDPATERLVERAVGKLLEGRTGIIIAHRLATVARADTILILDKGRILEHGPRLLLAQDPDAQFARLLKTDLAEVLV
jgi:ATP-binding cassette subfamily B protein